MSHFKLNSITEPINTKDGMTHAVLQSIYNHAESTKNDQARMSNSERGGVWSEELLSIVGSRDWTLKREKVTPQTLSLAKRFYEDALNWLIVQEHAKAVAVSVWEAKPNVMGRSIIITLTNGEEFEVPFSEVNK